MFELQNSFDASQPDPLQYTVHRVGVLQSEAKTTLLPDRDWSEICCSQDPDTTFVLQQLYVLF